MEERNTHKDISSSIIESSSGWDEAGDYGDIQFYDCKLAIDTKQFKKGDFVKTITFLYSQGLVQLWNYDEEKLKKEGFAPGEKVEEFKFILNPVF